MKLLLELSMECESLARAEAVAACEALKSKPKLLDHEVGVLIIDTEADPVALSERLGLCHYVSEWFCSCRQNELEACAEELDVDGPIRVRSTKVGEIKTDLAAASRRIGAIAGKAKGVDLHNPRTEIRVVFSKRVHVGRMLGAIDRPSFERRKNRYLPYVYPASLHPKFARALVNLSRARAGQKLLDPFCGTGAIVTEASMVGIEAIGTDFSESMIEGARKNLAHLGAKAKLEVADVGDIVTTVGPVSGIATDPPYGRSTSTKGESLLSLYRRAFEAFSEVLRRGSSVAIVVPQISLLENATHFSLREEHGLRVHRSLMRHFCVLERR